MGDNGKHKLGRQPKSISVSEDFAGDQDCLDALKSKAREIVYHTPEIRLEKVARLKEAVEQGTYKIDSRKLAEILIEELNLKR